MNGVIFVLAVSLFISLIYFAVKWVLELSAHEQTRKDIEEQLVRARKESPLGEMTLEIKELKIENMELKNRVANFTSRCDYLGNEIQKLLTELSRLRNTQEGTGRELQSIKDEYEKERTNWEATTQENIKEIRELNYANQGMVLKRNELSSLCSSLEEEVRDKTREMNTQREEFETKKVEYHQRVEGLEAEKTQLTQEKKALEERLLEVQEMEATRTAKLLYFSDSLGRVVQLLENEWQHNIGGVQEKYFNLAIGENGDPEEPESPKVIDSEEIPF